ncbi:flightin isoform X2 [Rhodnius prolixus]|uniref:flightin isoform X2 n=1 Tax=Rhodnius prolixus TaxID=13249 RepID=UPI003D18F375
MFYSKEGDDCLGLKAYIYQKMMDDEPWIIEDPQETAAAEEPKKVDRPLARPPPAPPTEVTYMKKKLNKHWARPTFLQYDYIYTYMHNYYDDYIDYLDRRQRGLEVEPPRPQTWAERALRSYARNTYPFSYSYRLPRRLDSDSALMYTSHWANTWHSEHTKDFYNRKYKSILF